MYWGNVHKLAQDLREGRVDEKERFKYYLAVFTLLSIVVPVFFYSVGPFGVDDLIYLISGAMTGVIGIILCYRVNRSGNNIDFIPRMICLSWTVAVLSLLFLFLIPLDITRLLFEAAHGFQSFLAYVSEVEYWSRWPSISLTPLFVAAYFGIIYIYLVRISQAKKGRILLEMMTSKLTIGKALLGVLTVVLIFPGTVFVFMSIEMLMFPETVLVFRATEDFIRKHEILEATARLAGYVAVALWLLLVGWIFAVLLRRSVKDA